MKRAPTALLIIASCASSLALTGCFNSTPSNTTTQSCTDTKTATGLCAPKSNEALKWISTQVASQQAQYKNDLVSLPSMQESVDSFVPSAASDSTNGPDIEASDTNTIEDGVAESDWVKVIDNRYLVTPKQPKVDYQYVWKDNSEAQKVQCKDQYYLDDFMIEPALDIAISTKTSQPYYNWCDGRWELDNIEITKGELNVFEMIQTPASSQLTSSTELNPYSNYIQGLYDVLDDKGLLVLSSLSDQLPDMRSHYGWWHNKSGIDLIDVSDPVNPKSSWSIKLDGHVADSRVVGDELIVISRRSPYEIEQFRNTLDLNALSNIPHDKLMGTIQVNDNEPQLLGDIETCLLPQDERPSWGITFTYLTKIDLNNPNNIQTICTLAPMHSIYMNQHAIYFLTSDYNWQAQGESYYKTNLDRFDLKTFGYTNSLSVDGSLGWGIDSNFRIKEQQLNEQTVLTLVLTERIDRERKHYIRNYEVLNDTFTLLDTYPEQGEKAIGKEREDIFSARIDGQSVQIVTYLNTDPLYEFNISDPSNIWMESELEIPGFSTYLHNIEDTELTVGLGKTDDNRLKVELYDQSGTESSVLGTLEMQSRTHSPATNDYKAFTSLNDKDNQIFKIALPIQRWGYYDASNTFSYKNMAGLWLIEIDYSSVPATIRQINDIEITDKPSDVYQSRSVIRGTAVHYALNGEVYSTKFSEGNDIHQSTD